MILTSLVPPLNLDSMEPEIIWELAFNAGRRSTKVETIHKLKNLKMRCMQECEKVYDETGSPRASMCQERIIGLDVEAHEHEWMDPCEYSPEDYR